MSESDPNQSRLSSEVEALRARLSALESGEAHLLARAVESSRNGIVIADALQPDMPLILVNPAFEAMTGYGAEECVGHNCRFLHGEDRAQPELDRVREAIREQRDCKVVLRNFRKDGALFWNELYLSPIFDSKSRLTHYIGVQNDITRRVQLQEAKDMFLRVASHDLKSPLAAIITTAGVLPKLAPVGAEITPELHGMMANVLARAKEMQRIIEDYLDFQALEDGAMRLQRESFDLAEAIRKSVEDYADRARSKSIELAFDPPSGDATVQADRVKIGQVAQNLIGNAIKFGARGGKVQVGIACDPEGVCVRVTDNGPGLTEEDLSKVFGRYARLSNQPTAGEKSSGLGLYICKKLIDLHGGRIGVENNNDRGATFWFNVPRHGD